MKLVAGVTGSIRMAGPRIVEWHQDMAVVVLRWRACWYLGVQIVCRLMSVSYGNTMTSGEGRLTWQTLGILKPQHQGEQREVI